MGWLLHVPWFLGFRSGQGNDAHYLFWSGIGSDIGELAIIGFLWAFLRKHNCHVKGCWRLGRHPVDGTPYVVCRRHHPEGKPTAEDIRRRYHLYLGTMPGEG